MTHKARKLQAEIKKSGMRLTKGYEVTELIPRKKIKKKVVKKKVLKKKK